MTVAGRIVTLRDRARAVGNALNRTKGNLHITHGQAETIRHNARYRQVGLWCDVHRFFVAGLWPKSCAETSCKLEPVYRKLV